jgi:hypothetical protein
MSIAMTETVMSFYPPPVLEWFERQGIPVYEWRYRAEFAGRYGHGYPASQRWIGPMADEVEAKFPHLVAHDGVGRCILLEAVHAAAGVPFVDELHEYDPP